MIKPAAMLIKQWLGPTKADITEGKWLCHSPEKHNATALIVVWYENLAAKEIYQQVIYQ